MGDMLGDPVGDAVGNMLGDMEGDAVGGILGDLVGDAVGDILGDLVVGDAVGDLLGDLEGDAAGDLLGDIDGSPQMPVEKALLAQMVSLIHESWFEIGTTAVREEENVKRHYNQTNSRTCEEIRA